MNYKYTSQKSFQQFLEKTKHLKGLNRMTDQREDVENELQYLVRRMKQEGLIGFKQSSGGYAYYPNKNFTMFTASDDSEIKSDLLGFLLDYIVEGPMEYNFSADYIADMQTVKKQYDQAGFEGAGLAGDESVDIEKMIDQVVAESNEKISDLTKEELLSHIEHLCIMKNREGADYPDWIDQAIEEYKNELRKR